MAPFKKLLRPDRFLPRFISCWIALALFAASSGAQEAQAPKRPRIGLVLEGGGALGFAHVGVLKWFEDHRIPVDFVAGTSMGGLIGGLYATGERPSEIQALARNIDWDKTLNGEVGFQDLSYRRKEDRIDYPNRLVFGLKGGLRLPGGLNPGHEIGLILDRAVLPYFSLRSFDDLPIPFRCVATEMVSGKKEVFDKGSLSLALRSTMSIPAVFSPVRVGDKIYTDGGALDNLPVDEAKSMGADIIIAVYLSTGAEDPKTYNSLLGAAARNISIMITANELRSIQAADILLTADLKGFTSADFKKSEEIIPKGVEAAEKKATLLEKFSLDEQSWKEHLARREARRRPNIPIPTFVKIVGADPVLEKDVQTALSGYAGKPVDPPALESDLSKLNGLGRFDSLGYNLTEEDGKDGLLIRVAEKDYAPPFLNLGINIDGTDANDIRFGMAGRVTYMDLGGFRSELRMEAFFGANYGLRSEYYHPFTPSSRWFVAPRGYLTKLNFEVYDDQSRISQYREGRSGLGMDLGYSVSRRSEVRIGQDLAWWSDTLRIGVPLVPNATYTLGISGVHYRYYGQDNVIVPRKGFIVRSDANWFSGRPDGSGGYPGAELRASYFKPITKPASVFLTASGGSTFGTNALGGQSFTLGGPLNLGAYGRNELIGNQYYLFQAGYLREMFKLNPLVGDALYVLGYYEVGKVYASPFPSTPKNPMDASGMILVKTLVGPAFIGASWGDSGRRKWWFGVGRVF